MDGAFLNESGDDDDPMSGPQVHWEAVPSQWGEPAPNPRALAEKSPNFPRLRWMDLLQRQRILLSNPAWGGAQYEGWWRDADIRPERLDDIARALQPRPRPQALPDPKSDDPLPPESAPEKRILTISDRDHRVLKQLQNDLQSREPRRVADDSRHPP